jgi:hypothetical protein
MMHGREKSDSAIVAGKPTNKAVSTAAEPVERRAEAKGNASQQSTRRTQSRVSVSHALERIRQAVTKNALPSHTQGGSRMPRPGGYPQRMIADVTLLRMSGASLILLRS